MLTAVETAWVLGLWAGGIGVTVAVITCVWTRND